MVWGFGFSENNVTGHFVNAFLTVRQFNVGLKLRLSQIHGLKLV